MKSYSAAAIFAAIVAFPISSQAAPTTTVPVVTMVCSNNFSVNKQIVYLISTSDNTINPGPVPPTEGSYTECAPAIGYILGRGYKISSTSTNDSGWSSYMFTKQNYTWGSRR